MTDALYPASRTPEKAGELGLSCNSPYRTAGLQPAEVADVTLREVLGLGEPRLACQGPERVR